MGAFSQEQLKELLKQTHKKGSETSDLTSKQLVEEIATILRSFVNGEKI
ncbi:hypothetical protein AB3N04_13230 [Alkalihalophilus sp. As8PL]|uniref:Uncharacterized protein n=1 Tax=Alkalihalophilus sp. As8PL TaxID=3237103 RepID=A0AB39BQI9_9BACI